MAAEIHSHGGRAREVAVQYGFAPDDVLDLSASLHPAAPDVVAIAARHLDELRHYPSPDKARDAMAEAVGVEPGRLLMTNGAAEAIALLAAHLGVGRIDEPEFALYRRHLSATDDTAPQWRSNPNNPLGMLSAPDDTAAVWDESFYAIATGTWTRGDDSFRIGSLTKLWACPGLRLGYLVCTDDAAAAAIAARQPQWALNGLAGAVVEPMLAATDLSAMYQSMLTLRSDTAAVLRGHGLGVRETDASWLLVDNAAALIEPLARQGVFVRDCTNFGLAGTVRIAVPRPRDLERLSTAVARAVDGNR